MESSDQSIQSSGAEIVAAAAAIVLAEGLDVDCGSTPAPQPLPAGPARPGRPPGALARSPHRYRADLTVLADNPLTVPDLELADLPVLLTVVDARPVFRAAEL